MNNLNDELKERIEAILNNNIPFGYRKNKSGISPDEWRIFELGKVLKRIKRPVKVELNEEYRQIGIRSHGKGLFYKEAVSGNELGNKSVFWIEPDCFIVNIVFAWELAIGKTTENEKGMIASHRFPMYQALNNKIDIDYMLFYFKSKMGKYLLELASPGGAGRNKTLGQTEFMKLKISFPSLNEQKKIAEILSTWDKAIELKEQLIEEKKQQKKGLMKKLLTGELRLTGFEGEWEEVLLSKISEINKGKQLNKSNMIEDGIYPALNGGINPSGLTNKWNTVEDTITISEGGNSCGYVNYIREKFWCGGHCYSVVPIDSRVVKTFLYQILKYNEPLIMSLRVGSGLPNIQKKAIANLSFRIPKTDEQLMIARILENIDADISLQANLLKNAKLQKKGLMQLLLTGIVRVQC